MIDPDYFSARLEARAILKRLSIRDPEEISIEDIAWVEGALVIDDGLKGADARLVHTPGVTAILRVKRGLAPPGRRRFAIAHELGHLKLKHSPGIPNQCAEKEFQAWYRGQANSEVEANIFAAELLMPEELFVTKLARTIPSFELIEQLAAEFQTTLTATAIRYVDLCGERCAVLCSSAGMVCWSRSNPLLRRWIRKGQKLSSNSHAADYFKFGHVSTVMERVPLDRWFNTSQPETIMEQSRSLGRYNSLLTLLWMP